MKLLYESIPDNIKFIMVAFERVIQKKLSNYKRSIDITIM